MRTERDVTSNPHLIARYLKCPYCDFRTFRSRLFYMFAQQDAEMAAHKVANHGMC